MLANFKVSPLYYNSFAGKNKEGLIVLYREAFSGPPYFESFTSSEASEILEELLRAEGSNCLVAYLDKKIIGFCGGFRVDQDEEVKKSLNAVARINPVKTFYLAELAVKEKYRKQGCGTELVRTLLDYESFRNIFPTILTRTQAQNSNSIRIFKRTGFVMLPDLTQRVETWVSYNGNRIKEVQERIFLEKKL